MSGFGFSISKNFVLYHLAISSAVLLLLNSLQFSVRPFVHAPQLCIGLDIEVQLNA
jgi:hypothetical protein